MKDDHGGWPEIAGRLTAAGHLLPIRVYYEDTDFSGSVYHASYLRFMERGRTDYLRCLEIGHKALASGRDGEALSFAVRKMTLEFLKPATIDDLLEVETRCLAVEGARIVLAQKILRSSEILLSAEAIIAVINRAGRARRIPLFVRERLSARVQVSD